ncbi:hypothetical protein [Aeromicrobium sp.]|uniref:hypothetical protein n=1 Tax=Aeromicrobium sp. TaxID=1871063 RepID=UPI0019A582C0|nr:hypothetical protein [Aeromicrobium sp.]MBC7633132.1 hypothetical protein [Aeromicrobium sp.]
MISRRALLATGAVTAGVTGALVVADLTHRLDDVAKVLGVEPHPEPDPRDDRLIIRVAKAQGALLATVKATDAAHSSLNLDSFVTISRAHLRAVGRAPSSPSSEVKPPPADAATAVRSLETAYSAESRSRAGDARRAVSPDLARVLASMSAGLAQCARSVGALA